MIRAREELIANRLIEVSPGTEIQVLNGKYGAYITDGEKNGKIPKDREPKSLTQEECEAILLAAPVRPQRGRFGKKAPAKKAAAKKSREESGRRRGQARGEEGGGQEGREKEDTCREEGNGEEGRRKEGCSQGRWQRRVGRRRQARGQESRREEGRCEKGSGEEDGREEDHGPGLRLIASGRASMNGGFPDVATD